MCDTEKRQAGIQFEEIAVTPQMVEAGLEVFRSHHYDTDAPYLMECIYRAMAYASLDASEPREYGEP